MQITIVLYFVCSLMVINAQTLSHNDYEEFTSALCEGQCIELKCPLSTKIKVEFVRISYAVMEKLQCKERKRRQINENEEDYCHKMIKINLSKETDSECSNKSNCTVCYKQEIIARFRRCKELTLASITYICLPDATEESELILADTYIDLSCAHLVEHRIIIHKAHLTPNGVQTIPNKPKSGNQSVEKCTSIDVSISVSKSCSTKYKCQAGPNSLIPKYCSSQNLVVKYSCVPESILKFRNTIGNNVLSIDTEIPLITKKETPGKNIFEHLENKSSKDDKEIDRLWIGIVLTIILALIISLIIFLYWCRSQQHLRRQELSNKIKQANFRPPPSSIDKIKIDLAKNNHAVYAHVTDTCQQLLNDDAVIRDFTFGNNDCDFWKNTLSRYPKDIIRNDLPSCSLSVGSSGQMSAYQSESSKGNQSIVFNLKSSSDQTPL